MAVAEEDDLGKLAREELCRAVSGGVVHQQQPDVLARAKTIKRLGR